MPSAREVLSSYPGMQLKIFYLYLHSKTLHKIPACAEAIQKGTELCAELGAALAFKNCTGTAQSKAGAPFSVP